MIVFTSITKIGMGKSIVFDDVLLVSLVDCTYSLFFTLVVPAAGYNIMFVCSASYVFGLIILSRLRTLNRMYNILKRIQVLSDAHAMSKASLLGLLDLEDEVTVLPKGGNWLLRHGVSPQKTSIYLINTL